MIQFKPRYNILIAESAADLRKQVVFAVFAGLFVLVPFTSFEIVGYFYYDTRTLFSQEIFRKAIFLNLALIMLMTIFILVNYFKQRLGMKPLKIFYPSFILLTYIILSSLIIHLHWTGSQSAHVLMMIVATMFLTSWYMRIKDLVVVFMVGTFAVFGLMLLEFQGVLSYAPLFVNGAELGETYLRWQVICMNGGLFAASITMMLMVIVRLRNSIEQNNRDLSFANEALQQQMAHRKHLERELQELATTDSLTGVSNRRHFMERAHDELIKAHRYNRTFALFMLDVDHFKQINDSYSHEVGDKVLVSLAKTCKRFLRSTDIFGRIGGEEFAAVLLEADLNAALDVADRLREELAQTMVMVDGVTIKFTVSIGVAVLGHNMATLDALIRAADRALYAAKNNGRNCVVNGNAAMIA